MNSFLKYGAFLAIFVLFTSCQTAPINDFGKVKNGMTKDDVLDLLGSPSRTERSNDQEKWSYRYWTGDDRSTENLRQVTFFDSKVVSFGEDAEELHRLKEIQLDDAARVERRNKNLSTPVAGAPPQPQEATVRPPMEEDFVEMKGKKEPVVSEPEKDNSK